MYTVESIFQAQTEVKRSKFLSFLVPYNQFKEFHEELKAKHPKANHIIYAYRYLNEFAQIVENSSDDGEPKGAAATPTLNQLRGSSIIEAGILTVRYFGGIKLGVGGMVRAYSSAAKAAIEAATLIPYEKSEEYIYTAPYSMQRQVEYYLERYEISDIVREFENNFVRWIITAPDSKLSKLRAALKQLLV